ncbi:MAG: hypothetical protein ACKOXB_10010 [Flavobacteriales bacterium]
MKKIPLDQLVSEYFFRAVKIVVNSKYQPEGYLIGIKLPYDNMLMLYMVPQKHVEKYIKSGNKNWMEIVPYEMIKEISIVSGYEEKEESLKYSYEQRMEEMFK